MSPRPAGRSSLALVAGLSSLTLLSAHASAETMGSVTDEPAVSDAFEIAIGGGYTVGLGGIGNGMDSVQDLTKSGAGAELKLGYRITPTLAVGVFGTVQGYARGDKLGDDRNALAATAGVYADYHLRPEAQVDPWLSLATGWRGLWLASDEMEDISLQGLEVIRLQLGVDYRISREVAIAPVLGASASMFLAQANPDTDDYESIEDPELNLYFFGGLQGRFNLM